MRYLISFLMTLGILLLVQMLALNEIGGRTVKSESNYFSSIGRIQAGAVGRVEVMLLGSSITGRLPDRAQGFSGWANMGCDGGSAVDVLRAIDAGILPAAPLLVIEANTLQLALEKPETEIGHAMQAPWFQAGLRLPIVAAYARPSAFLYSKLLMRRTGAYGNPDGDGLVVRTKPATVTVSRFAGEREQQLIDELAGILGRLRSRGTDAVLVWLPPGRAAGEPVATWIPELARQAGVKWWDLGGDAGYAAVTLTDGVHMDAPSAAKTMRSLREAVRRETLKR